MPKTEFDALPVIDANESEEITVAAKPGVDNVRGTERETIRMGGCNRSRHF